MNIDDCDLVTGAVTIRRGKGRKSRVVFLGQRARKALRAYLKSRRDEHPALFVTAHGAPTRLTYRGLFSVVTHRASQAGIEPPALHGFRRAFAVNMLRAGVDIYSLQELMGHSDTEILKRYLKLTSSDLRAAHVRGSPVDKARL